MEVLPKEHIKGRLIEVGGYCWWQGLLGMLYQELVFACDSGGYYLGNMLAEGASAS